MASLSSSGLTPRDAAAALRSFPRRYRELFTSFEGDDTMDALALRLGPTGESAAQVVSDVTRTWALQADALQRVLFTNDAVLHPALSDPSQRVWDTPHPESLDDTLVLLGHEADGLVEVIERVSPPSDWARSAPVAGGSTVTALDIVRDAVETGADGLRRAHTALTGAT